MSDYQLNLSSEIRRLSKLYGFDQVGISKAQKLEEQDHLSEWLNRSYQGEMRYLEDHFEKRLDPSKLMPGSKSVVSFLYNYFPQEELTNSGYKIARYAYGKDYHKVIKKKLINLIEDLKMVDPNINTRVFVDSAPIMERQWAARSGLGWLGKNTLLINPKKGSYFFLAEILIDRELEYDGPIKDYCGSCTKCLDACPTEAFEAPYVLNASKCISYFTIELKDDKELPEEYQSKFNDWIFGCDICQEVCPWNRFSKPHQETKFEPNDHLKSMNKEGWLELEEAEFNEMFSGSAVKRTKYNGLKRNISFVKKT